MSGYADAKTTLSSSHSFAAVRDSGWRSLALTGAFAGLAGGLAEVVWVGLYCGTTGASGASIARHVADTVIPGVLPMAAAPSLGLAIHFGLSLALGLLLIAPLTSITRHRTGTLLPICLGVLGLIWAMNFMVVLPVVNPVFPLLLPAWVTLTSKLLFGAAVAGVIGLRRGGHA